VTTTPDLDVPTPVPVLPELAKTPAVQRLMTTLVGRGIHEHTARAIAYAVCDPSAVRRQLDQPAEIRLNGGALEVVHTQVWVPAVLPYPENPRMLPGLTYAVEDRAERRRPLPPARPGDNRSSPELVMEPVPTTDLVGYLDAQLSYLRNYNDLTVSVGNHGILSELLLVPLVFEVAPLQDDLTAPLGEHDKVRDHEEMSTILTSVDGNSRLAGAYRHLRLDPSDVILRLMGDPRALRQRIGTILAFDGSTELTEEQACALRSLTSPAAIVIGFRPDAPTLDLAQAVQSRLGAIHVAPAKQWSAASQYDLLLSATLDARAGDFDNWAQSNGFTGSQYFDWLAGNLSAADATTVGLDPEPDVRAASLRWWLRDRNIRISRAIRRLDVVRAVTPQVRANIAAEGALRSFRSELRTDTEADNARRVLAALWQVEDLDGDWDIDDVGGLGSLRTLTTKATAEIAAAGRPGENARLLMVVAFYWLARLRLVPLQTRGGMKDRRKVGDVVTLMSRTEHGIRQLARIVEDGRAGAPPRRVGPDGKVLLGAEGGELPFTDVWMRQTWNTGNIDTQPLSPEKDLENREAELLEAIEQVTDALDSLRDPLAGDGTPLVETTGVQIAAADKALEKLGTISATITEYRFLAKRTSRRQS
jgi:hypothetical protein